MSKSDQTVIDHTHWFIADTHLGHPGILNQAARPYRDIREHDQDIVRKWNELVQPKDTVWHLGDLAWEDAPFDYVAATFKRLNGVKRLIIGNHDSDDLQINLAWASVDVMRTIVAPDCKIVLCHYPLLEWEGYFGGNLHFHGHTHDRVPSTHQWWDCGVDHQSFLPMTLAQIRERMVSLSS